MIAAAKDEVRALLRGARSLWRHLSLALDYRREHGLGHVFGRLAEQSRRAQAAPPAAASSPASGAVFDVIYAIGYWDGEPKRYRVFNPAEGLRAAGYVVHIMPFDRIGEIARRRWRARTLVLFRAEDDPLVGVAAALAYARGAGMRVIYDIDDLVFDPGIACRIAGLQSLGRHRRREFIAATARRRRLLLACDQVTVSTVPLARAVAALGRTAAVIPNSLNDAQLHIAAETADRPRPGGGPLRIGYFSGSRTHQRDFAVCQEALQEILRRYERTVFRVVGHLDLGPCWEPFAGRVERIGFVPPGELLRLIAECDINLAPLERGNPFCEAKSELKFFEAGVVGVPTVASATEPFAAAIEDGVSGFVVADTAQWLAALELLCASTERRKAVGAAAKQRAVARHGLAAVVPQTIAALGLPAPAASASS
jgi:glycosyltransferase involved in cell wall biosynthesis